jgi:hypothetical protein
MAEFFIKMLGVLISIIVVVAFLGVIVAAIAAASSYRYQGVEAIILAFGVLIGGILYVSFMAGFMYLGLGIYNNTKRTAEATAELLNK